MPNNLTDNEIKKACENCFHYDICLQWSTEPLNNADWCNHFKDKDLINRQEEEIESLKAEVERLKETNKNMSAYVKGNNWGLVSFVEFCKNLKAEAYKEIADTLTAKFIFLFNLNINQQKAVIELKNNLLNELVGEKD